MTPITWRKSSYSAADNVCIELAATGDAIRDSKHPDAGHVAYDVGAVTALIDAAESGALDHLA